MQVRIGRIRHQDPAHLLAHREAQHLRRERAPRRLDPPGRLAHADRPVAVVHVLHRPRPAAEQERRHPLHEAVHEVLLQRANLAPRGRFHGVERRAREHRVQLEKVLPAIYLLRLLAQRQQTTRLEQVAIREQMRDQRIELAPPDPAEIRHARELFPAALHADPAELERHG